ncbi:MAG: PQQ-dependent sugar dehydrogenase, partial [Candidatus Competibacteraceae bacterium]|nr:PQQ-dependent sugar dehydrogenase [Candidatus Competibacteraceae bacterium]
MPYVTGLQQPVALVNAGDQRLFVAEQGGRIRVIDPDGQLLPQPFLDISDQVVVGSEEGLLSLAFHPDFASNGYVFVYYIVAGVDGNRSRIARYTVDAGDPNRADPASETVILEFAQPDVGHKGGTLAFGPDGLLYSSFGDGHTVPFPEEGGEGDPLDSAQNDSQLLGKLVRLDVDIAPGSGAGDCDLSGNNHYRIPADNAYNDGPGGGCDEIYASGLRNPWRFSFDTVTGDLWLGDVGYAEREEINFVPADTPGGLNFGWRCYEGSQAYNLDSCPASDTFTFPVHDYGHDAGKCSVTGGYVYRGSRYPDLVGHYLFSDWCHTAVSALQGAPDAVEAVEIVPPGAVTYPTAFGEDVDGELYVVSLIPGTIFRVVTADEADDTDNQPTTGEELYLAKGCAGCHGSDGSGIIGPPLTGPYADRTALVERIDTTMPFLNAVACTDDCLELIADYILATFV